MKAKKQAVIADKKKQDVTFDDFFHKTYLPSCLSKKANTLSIEKNLYDKWIAPVLGRLPFSKIKALNLTKIQRSMTEEGKAPRSIQYVMQIARQVWNKALDDDITADPFPKISLEKFDNNRIRFLTPEETEKLLSELKNISKETYGHAVMALNTGMRAGEIWALTWADVDLEHGLLTLRNTKNGKTRIAYLNDATSKLLTDRKPEDPDPSGLVFPGKGGAKVNKISRTFKRVADKIGLNEGISDPRQKIVFHSCRHTFASRLVKNHIDVYLVKELLGHSDLKMTTRYAHNAPGSLKAAVSSLVEKIQKRDRISELEDEIERLKNQNDGNIIPFKKEA